jgi:hypothetical protein
MNVNPQLKFGAAMAVPLGVLATLSATAPDSRATNSCHVYCGRLGSAEDECKPCNSLDDCWFWCVSDCDGGPHIDCDC